MMDAEASPGPDSAHDSISSSDHQQLEDEQLSDDDSTGPSSVKAEMDEDSVIGPGSTQMPAQKRRRVTRACDECRRKKIKCDGKQPCTHCSVYSYNCTYDKPSNRRRNPAPQYVEALESKLVRAEALLRKFIPDLNLSDPSLDPAVQQEFSNREQQRLQAAKQRREEALQKSEQDEARITSMIGTIGQLSVTEGGGWDFRGTSSGAVFLYRMQEHFGGLLGSDSTASFLPRASQWVEFPGLSKLDLPGSSAGYSPGSGDSNHAHHLPSKERARQLTGCALTCATALLRIVHVPSFFEKFERIFDKPTIAFDVEDSRFLGLLYAVMAVGAMYNMTEEGIEEDQNSYNEAAAEGIKYYTSARTLLQDVSECRDLTSLQALLFLILFLQATSNLSGCYAFLGIASRAALRMGLHRHLLQANFTPLVTELRRRMFYFIRQLDIYCSALLGLPILLHDEDVDQQLPTEVDDQFISEEEIQQPPPGTKGSFFQAFNAHSRLMGILMKVVKYIYPLKGIEACATPPTANYTIKYGRIKEIENDLHVWREQLPERWRPSLDGPIEVTRVRTLLRFAYAQVQMMLYRPFLHYISPRTSTDRTVDERYYACAAAGISESRNVIHIAMEIKNQALVIGPYCSMLYTEFFAILTLVFYVLENPDKQGSAEIWADAAAGKAMIAKLAGRSFAAHRLSKSMDKLWENLPEAIKNKNYTITASRKRSAPGLARDPDSVTTKKSAASSAKSTTIAARRSVSNKRSSLDDLHRTSPQYAMSFNYPEHDILDIRPFADGIAGPLASASTLIPTGSSQPQESSSIYKPSALMVPPGEQFAYPSQPLDFSAGPGPSTHAESHPALANMIAHTTQPTNSRNYCMPGLYGDIEGQFMGPLPPDLMQTNHNKQNNFSTQFYQIPNALEMQQAQAQHRQQQQQHVHYHQEGRDMDDLMADSGFNRAWYMFGGEH